MEKPQILNLINKTSFIYLFLCLCTVSIYSCSLKKHSSNSANDDYREVYDVFLKDTIANLYLKLYKEGNDADWKKYLIANQKSYYSNKLGMKFTLFVLPRDCSGCYNYFQVVQIRNNYNKYTFPLMDHFYYRSTKYEKQLNDKVCLENQINLIIQKENKILSTKENIDELIIYLLDSLYQFKEIKLNEDENILQHKFNSTAECANLNKKIINNIGLKYHDNLTKLYYYDCGIFSVTINSRRNNYVNIELLNKECFGCLMF